MAAPVSAIVPPAENDYAETVANKGIDRYNFAWPLMREGAK